MRRGRPRGHTEAGLGTEDAPTVSSRGRWSREWRRAASRLGGAPNSRRYSRLNWDGLSYPTRWATPVTSCGWAASSSRASCSRICFWNWIGPNADAGSAEVFRDEDVTYAARVWAGGGQGELHVWAGGFHGFDASFPDAALSVEARRTRTDRLTRTLNAVPAPARAGGASG